MQGRMEPPRQAAQKKFYGIFRINISRLSCRITSSLFSHLSIFACSQLPFFLHFFVRNSDQLFLSVILAANDLYTILYPP